MAKRYDAFMSYSWNADSEFAPLLRDGLHQLAKPWNRRRALSVFLDKASLEASAGLKTALQGDLDNAEYLVLLASPDSAQSSWVGDEVRHWLDSDGLDRLRLVLTDGDIVWDSATGDFDPERSTAIGPALRGVFPEEPLWVDMRWAKADPHPDIRRNERFKNDVATLAAPMHGMSKEELVGADLDAFRKARRLRRAAIAGLAILTIVSVVAGVLAVNQARIAVENQREAELQAATATSRLLASQSADQLDADQALGTLLAIEAGRVPVRDEPGAEVVGTAEAARSVVRAVARWPALERQIPGASNAVAVALNPDGSRLAVGRRDGVIEVHDLTQPASMEVVREGGSPVRTVTFDSAGRELRWMAADEGAMLDLDSGRIATWEPPPAGFGDAVSGDAQVVAHNEFDTIVLTPSEGAAVRFPVDGFAFPVALNDDGSLLAFGTDLTVSVVDWRSGDERMRFAIEDVIGIGPGEADLELEAIRFSDDGSTVSVVVGEMQQDFISADSWLITAPLDAEPSAAYLFEQRGIVAVSEEYVLTSAGNVFDPRAFAALTDEPVPLGPQAAAGAFDADGRRLATVDTTGDVFVWSVAERLGSGVVTRYELELSGELHRSTNAIRDDGGFVAGHAGGIVSLTVPGQGTRTADIQPGSPDLPLVSVGPGGRVVATTARQTVVLDDSLTVLGFGFPAGGSGGGLAPDGSWLVVATADQDAWDDDTVTDVTIRRLSVADGSELGDPIRVTYGGSLGDLVLEETQLAVRALFEIAVSPDGASFAIDLGDRVDVFDVATHDLLYTIPGAGGPLAYDSGGSRLAVDLEPRAAIVDPKTGDVITPLATSFSVGKIAFSRAGDVLAIASSTTVRLVDTTTGLVVVDRLSAPFMPTFINQGTDLGGVVFTDDQEVAIVTAPAGGNTLFETARWDLDTTALTEAGCRRAGRNITEAEWVRFFGDVTYRVTCPAFPSALAGGDGE